MSETGSTKAKCPEQLDDDYVLVLLSFLNGVQVNAPGKADPTESPNRPQTSKPNELPPLVPEVYRNTEFSAKRGDSSLQTSLSVGHEFLFLLFFFFFIFLSSLFLSFSLRFVEPGSTNRARDSSIG